MSDLTLTLGDFKFSRLEIPENISFGGEQHLVVHEFIGGVRVIDAMGRSDKPLEWGGLMRGDSALGRARYLDGLRIAGKPLALKWHEMSYNVVIQSFTANFERYYQIPYHISCVVVQDLTTPVNVISADSITGLINADMTTATTIGTSIGDKTLSGKLTTLTTAIKQVSDFAKATQTQINSVLLPLADAVAQVKVLTASVSGVIQNVTTLGGVLPNNPVAQSANKLLSQAVAMISLPQLYSLNSVLGRIGGNIGAIGSSSKTYSQAGGNLYGVASEFYGDATAWTGIARANKLTDPQLTGLNTLKIPANPDTFGGVLSA